MLKRIKKSNTMREVVPIRSRTIMVEGFMKLEVMIPEPRPIPNPSQNTELRIPAAVT